MRVDGQNRRISTQSLIDTVASALFTSTSVTVAVATPDVAVFKVPGHLHLIVAVTPDDTHNETTLVPSDAAILGKVLVVRSGDVEIAVNSVVRLLRTLHRFLFKHAQL